MVTTTQTFEELALTNPSLELYEGVIRKKPVMSIGHTFSIQLLTRQLHAQIDVSEYWVVMSLGRLKRSERTYFVPDIMVIPIALIQPDRSRWNELDVYDQPVALVVEVWSPSTGQYDIDEKIPEYMARGDLEIWRLHPFEPSLVVWRRQADGSYVESRYHGGTVRIESLPGVVIDLDLVFP